MRTYVTRRARLHENEDGRYAVSDGGELQAELLATHLLRQPESLDAIYAGTSDRHRETVSVLTETCELIRGRDVPTRKLSSLDDVPWSKEPLKYCIQEGLGQREWVRAWLDGDLDLGERPPDVRERVLDAKRTIVDERDDDDTVLVVTSAIPLLTLTADALDRPLSATDLPVDNAALFELCWGDADTVGELNATPHLPGDLVTRNGFRALSWPPGQS